MSRMVKKMYRVGVVIISLLVGVSSLAQGVFVKQNPLPEFLRGEAPWADDVIDNMTLDEKIGQLFMVAAYSNKGEEHITGLEELIEDHHIGGLIFFKGTPIAQAEMCNRLQAKSTVPMMIAMDAEWGLSMRLDSTVKYPKQMTLGAVQNDTLIYAMGSAMADELHRIGVQINFAPVVDVNNNPNNPIIGYRSFGENKYNVARKGTSYMKGLQDGNILTTAKHFPGHGDTDADSHLELPLIDHDKSRLDTVELFPFRHMMARQLSGVMVAHLYIPALDSTPNLASTLSPNVVKDLLRDEMGFEGLAFTDALNMKGVSKYFKPGEVDLKALLAGNDVLLFPEDVPLAVKKIKEAIAEGVIKKEEINRICYRILKAKSWVGLNKYSPTSTENLTKELNNYNSTRLRELLYENAMTVLKNDSQIIPFRLDEEIEKAILTIGGKGDNFTREMSKYGKFTLLQLPTDPTPSQVLSMRKKLKNTEKLVVSIRGLNNSPKKEFGLSDATVALVDSLNNNRETTVVYFGNPYGLKKMNYARSLNGLIVTYEDNETTAKKAAELLYGYSKATGKLPVSVGAIFVEGEGLSVNTNRPYQVLPEEIGIQSSWLQDIDSVIQDGLDENAYPGCVVMIAKKGKIFYNKAFGYHTYDEKQPVRKDDIYDLASITKIVSTTTTVMKLQQEGLIDIDKTLGDYLPMISDTSDYKDMVIKDVLTHQAGLVAWIPFYLSTLEAGAPSTAYYSKKKQDEFQVRVSQNLYLDKHQSDTILDRILATKLREKRDYKYSDLGYYLIKEIIERVTDEKLDAYVADNFYTPMGLSTIGYHPRKRFSLDRVVPTEYDMYFRKQKVHGDVHDPGAAMQGGVGGHAGIFADGRDLLSMMQMYLDYGEFDNEQYIDSNQIARFTDCQFCTGESDENRRGIGFDKPNRHNGPGPTCDCVSFTSFGHSGFTGTLAWVDPEKEITYIFLSNRIYPSADNRKLIKMNIRTRIMDVLYSAIDKSEGKLKINPGLKL
ncbi:MAG: beta-N-acetylhexosaminidase [Patiriisocius sp.]|jgi:beta-N-acetylhexosaminidase